MIKIAICDDDPIFLKIMKKSLLEIETDELKEIQTFDNPKTLASRLQNYFYNIVFLDFDMPTLNGFELANKINALTQNTIIVLVTSHENIAIKGYEFNVFRFIRKKDLNEDLNKVLSDILKKIIKQRQTITLSYKSITHTIKLIDIYYVLSFNNYITIKKEKSELKFRTEVSKIKSTLLSTTFATANRGILVNCSKIVKIDQKKLIIYLNNGEYIKISKSGFHNIKLKLLESE